MPELKDNGAEALEAVKKARIGDIVPIFKVVSSPLSPLEFFSKLSNYGRKKYSFFLESAEAIEKYGERSLGTSSPCLRLSGKKEEFEIQALNATGREFLKALKGELKFCDQVKYGKESITGKIMQLQRSVPEQQRLKLKNHMDIIRTVAFKFRLAEEIFTPSSGLFGMFGYDFIDQFEAMPENKEDILQEPDYELYFADNLFLADHRQNITYIVANVLVTTNRREELYKNAVKTIKAYEKALSLKSPKAKKFRKKKQAITADVQLKEFENALDGLKKHILQGDVFQIFPSRTIITDYNAEPMDIYKALREMGPASFMFFVNHKSGVLLGASPQPFIRVQGAVDKTIELHPASFAKPRGLLNNKIDMDLDSRYEVELKTNAKGMVGHTMLLDLARNDVARVSKPGTRTITESFVVEKYSHMQYLVSTVRGILRNDLDALHAYAALMNAGHLTGMPRIEAMNLLRHAEKTKRGFYGGAVCYIAPDGSFDSAATANSIQLKGNRAYIRAAAMLMQDSVPKNEAEETEKQAKLSLAVIRKAGGLK